VAHIRLWNWQPACSGHLNYARLRELTGQGRASYLWTWKWNCFYSVFTFSWGILALWIREKWLPSSIVKGGGQVCLMDRSTSASQREIISCLWATSLGMDSDLLPSQASTHFWLLLGSPAPLVLLGIPLPPLLSVPSDTTQAGSNMPYRPAPTWSRPEFSLKSALLAANVDSFFCN